MFRSILLSLWTKYSFQNFNLALIEWIKSQKGKLESGIGSFGHFGRRKARKAGHKNVPGWYRSVHVDFEL